jgi:hypothetical protein
MKGERREGMKGEGERVHGGKCDGETGTLLSFVSRYRHLRMMLKGM